MAVNILFTCAGRRNYLINYFRDALKGGGKVVAVLDIDSPSLARFDNVDKVGLEQLVHFIETIWPNA